jgi:superfamily I DNA and/or RNA helicase
VDNYQGEENNIILLSLVRSNMRNQIGFLKNENRVCVALSRAKHGMFIIGNMTALQTANIWKEIRTKLESHQAIGRALPLR